MSAPPGGSAGATPTGRTAFSLLLTLGLAVACRPNDDPIGPGTTNVGSRAFTVDTGAITPDGCGSINVRFTATTSAVAFPEPANCSGGWVLTSNGAATVVRDSTKWRLTIPVRWKNQATFASLSGFLMERPNADSAIVLLPGALYSTVPAVVSPEYGTNSWLWASGSTVNIGDYSTGKNLVLDFPVGTETAILRFRKANASGAGIATPTGVPAVPETWTAPEDSTLASASSDPNPYRIYRTFISVEFTAQS